MTTATEPRHQVVPKEEWLKARLAYLAAEKEFTRRRDELSRQRRELPWERVETHYVFEGPNGPQTLADLFAGRNQLIVYHFMLGPNWEEGCKSCSFLADHFDPARIHLLHRFALRVGAAFAQAVQDAAEDLPNVRLHVHAFGDVQRQIVECHLNRSPP